MYIFVLLLVVVVILGYWLVFIARMCHVFGFDVLFG